MLIQELFRRSVVGRSQVTQDIAIILAPKILQEFAAVPALGGSGKSCGLAPPDLQELLDSIPAYTEKQHQAFSEKNRDQSLSTHLINGLFVGMSLIEHLPEHKKLDEIDQRVWALGYTVHDYTKAYDREVSAGQLPVIRQLVSSLGELHDFTAFMHSWRDYLDDIVFIAQNTQTVVGANLNVRDYSLKLDKHQRETIRLLSSVTDLFVHVTSPSNVQYRDVRGRDLGYNLRQKIETLFGIDFAPRLAYHKLLEVRGLLSNLINNAVIDALEQQGYERFLFFPEGVIYLVPRHIQAEVNLTDLTKGVWDRVTKILVGDKRTIDNEDNEIDGGDDTETSHEEDEGGLRMKRTKDYIKVPPVLYELLDIESLVEMGRQTACTIRNNKTPARLGAEQAEEAKINVRHLSMKEKDEYFTALGKEWAAAQQLPVDIRADQLAECLTFLRYRIFAELFPKQTDVTAMLLDLLHLTDTISVERAERRPGGIPTGWFFVAASYLQKHPSLDLAELEEVTEMLVTQSLQFIDRKGLQSKNSGKTRQTFIEYAQQIIEIDGRIVSEKPETIQGRFADELQRYMQSKEKNKVVCSLCASPYEAQEQDASTVLFKPQQYSNKSPLDRSRLVRGICPICALEMTLRQVKQGLAAGKAQDQQTAYLYLYPSYFFTTETAQVIKLFENRLQNLNLPRLIFSHLEQKGFDYHNLFTYEDFMIDEEESDDNANDSRYSDEDLAALFFIPFKPLGRKLTQTDTWIVPSFFALALPLLLGVKCVATTSFAVLYSSASDFKETVLLDSAHPFTKYILKSESLRVDETSELVERLLRVYSLHLNVYADESNYHWGQLTNIAKDLATDPLYVFQYYDRYKRRDEERQAKSKNKQNQQVNKGISPYERQRYMGIYHAIGGEENMGFIGKLVEAYAEFYRAKSLDSAYAVLRPLSTAIDVVVESDLRTTGDDLCLLVAGAIHDDQERIRDNQAEGKNPILFNKELGDYGTRLALSRQKVEEFSRLFLQSCFADYCDSDRAILRERTNRIRSAARFYYLTHFGSHN